VSRPRGWDYTVFESYFAFRDWRGPGYQQFGERIEGLKLLLLHLKPQPTQNVHYRELLDLDRFHSLERGASRRARVINDAEGSKFG